MKQATGTSNELNDILKLVHEYGHLRQTTTDWPIIDKSFAKVVAALTALLVQKQ